MRVRDRATFMKEMTKAGVVVSQVHVRNDHHTMFAEFRRVLPGLDEFAAEQVSLPVGWWLSEEQSGNGPQRARIPLSEQSREPATGVLSSWIA